MGLDLMPFQEEDHPQPAPQPRRFCGHRPIVGVELDMAKENKTVTP
jgi:hypothetical protein